jgi:hypothetical protein
MKLLAEVQEHIKPVIVEASEGGKKKLYIEGVFMQYNNDVFKGANRNNRLYPESIMRPEVERYVRECVKTNRAYGELNHPQGPTINLDRVSHLIESLEFQKDGTIVGRAKILDTPMGNIVRGLIEGGANPGVSSRGMGSVKPLDGGLLEVQQDFKLVTAADVVADPSAQKAYVQGIFENVDWLYNDKTGEWVQEQKKQISKLTTKQLEEQQLVLFQRFLRTL